MSSGSSASAPMQSVPTAAAPAVLSIQGNLKLPSYPGEEDVKPEYDPSFTEYFSKKNLRLKVAEYFGGKYTEKYIHNYLEFMHINGMLNNLEYLEFKTLIAAGERA